MFSCDGVDHECFNSTHMLISRCKLPAAMYDLFTRSTNTGRAALLPRPSLKRACHSPPRRLTDYQLFCLSLSAGYFLFTNRQPTQPSHTAVVPSVFAKISQLVSSSVIRAKPTLTIYNSASSLIQPNADTRANSENAITSQCDRQCIANTRYTHNSPVNSPPPTKCVVKLVSRPSMSGDGKYHEMQNNTQAIYSSQRYFFSSMKPWRRSTYGTANANVTETQTEI